MNVSDIGCTVTTPASPLATATVTVPIGTVNSRTVYVPVLPPPSFSATAGFDNVMTGSSSATVTASVTLLPS